MEAKYAFQEVDSFGSRARLRDRKLLDGRRVHRYGDGSRSRRWSRSRAGARAIRSTTTRRGLRTLAKFGQMLFFEKDVAEAITVAGPVGRRRRDPEGRLRELPRHEVLRRLAPHVAGRARQQRAGPRPLARAQLAGAPTPGDGEHRLERVDPVGGPVRLPGRPRRGRLGHLGHAARPGPLRLREVQGRVQRGLPGHTARRPARAGPPPIPANVYPATGGPAAPARPTARSR